MDTPARLERIERLFHEALERAPHEFADFLSKACAEDATLRHEVESLLDSYREDENFLQAPVSAQSVAALADHAINQAEASIVGERVGPYRVIRELGRGGMGAVYLAERADGQFEQQVAIKILKRGLDTEQVLRRFRRERQILADLSHPNIARLLDGGMTNDGRPYLVMEYIAGQPIDDYADTHQLSIEERLKLFGAVCAAVQYAHEHRVIHRDLKPGNILIMEEGTPKLLDFGIAKLLDAEQSATPTPTALRVMTPEYASPEQLRGLHSAAASDVYSLGVVLYELLSGQRPYSFQSRLPREVLQTIQAADPLKPSVSAKRGAIRDRTPEAIAHARCTTPEELQRKLRGELDNIVLMALRKEPERRYVTVELFAEDVRRYLAGLVVVARKDTLGYRGVKFFKRHRPHILITATVAILCLLLGFWLNWFTTRLRVRESIAVLPFTYISQDPQAEFLADGLTDSLIDSLSRLPKLAVPAHNSVFRYKGQPLDPPIIGRALGVETLLMGRAASDGNDLSVRVELIEAHNGQVIWAKRYDGKTSELLTLPQGIAQEVAQQLGLNAPAEWKPHRRPTENLEAYRLYHKGQFYWNQRTELGMKSAIEYFEQALAKDPSFALAYSGLANSYSLIGTHKTILPREAFSIAKRAALQAIAHDEQSAEAHTSLALITWLHDWDWAGAEHEFRRAIELNPNYVTAPHWYGLYLAEMGRFDEAVAAEQRALELDPLSLYVHADLGRVYYYARRYEQSLRQYRRASEMNPNFSTFYLESSFSYEQMGLYDELISCLEKTDGRDKQYKPIYLKHGLRGVWQKMLETFMQEKQSNPFDVVYLYVRLGKKEQALDYLYRAYELQDHQMVQIKVEPLFDGLRAEPRFKELLRRMKLVP